MAEHDPAPGGGGRRDGSHGPVHPTFRAAALMAAVTLVIFVLALIGALGGR